MALVSIGDPAGSHFCIPRLVADEWPLDKLPLFMNMCDRPCHNSAYHREMNCLVSRVSSNSALSSDRPKVPFESARDTRDSERSSMPSESDPSACTLIFRREHPAGEFSLNSSPTDNCQSPLSPGRRILPPRMNPAEKSA
jgi:hypothetical protein